MSSVPSINAYAAVHTRHHSGENQSKQSDSEHSENAPPSSLPPTGMNQSSTVSSNIGTDDKGKKYQHLVQSYSIQVIA